MITQLKQKITRLTQGSRASAPPTLIGVTGQYSNAVFHLTGAITFGRDPQKCQIIYPDDTNGISSVHCRLTVVGADVELTDLGATYGTFLADGTKLTPHLPVKLPSGAGFYLADRKNEFRVSSSQNKSLQASDKKKLLLFGATAAALVILITIVVNIAGGSVFGRLVSDMLKEYPFANNAVAADKSYLKIDTNPSDIDMSKATAIQISISNDSLSAIQFVNKKLGFSDALYAQMMKTTALMGRQTEENAKYRVSWTYHPKHGLEVMYEKK